MEWWCDECFGRTCVTNHEYCTHSCDHPECGNKPKWKFIGKKEMIETIKIRMLETVRGIGFICPPGTIAREGREYTATSNPHGAISAICENGQKLGVKPGEFEFVEAPEWVLEIHRKHRLKER